MGVFHANYSSSVISLRQTDEMFWLQSIQIKWQHISNAPSTDWRLSYLITKPKKMYVFIPLFHTIPIRFQFFVNFLIIWTKNKLLFWLINALHYPLYTMWHHFSLFAKLKLIFFICVWFEKNYVESTQTVSQVSWLQTASSAFVFKMRKPTIFNYKRKKRIFNRLFLQ